MAAIRDCCVSLDVLSSSANDITSFIAFELFGLGRYHSFRSGNCGQCPVRVVALTHGGCGMKIVAARTRMFEPNTQLARLVILRLGLTAFVLIVSVATSAWFYSSLYASCLRFARKDIWRLSQAVFVCGWIHCASSVLFWLISCIITAPNASCVSRLRAFFRCCVASALTDDDISNQGSTDMFHSIAHILQHLFKVEGVTVSLSDVLAGLALVKGSQLLRRASGEQFLFAHKPKDGSADDVVHSLMRGQQPALSPEDRERFEGRASRS